MGEYQVRRDLVGNQSPRLGLSNSRTCIPGRDRVSLLLSDGARESDVKPCLKRLCSWGDSHALECAQRFLVYKRLWGQFGGLTTCIQVLPAAAHSASLCICCEHLRAHL